MIYNVVCVLLPYHWCGACLVWIEPRLVNLLSHTIIGTKHGEGVTWSILGDGLVCVDLRKEKKTYTIEIEIR